MSDERVFHEINEDELEQVSGGSAGVATYRCPVCGKEQKSSRSPICMSCTLKSISGKSVVMERVSD